MSAAQLFRHYFTPKQLKETYYNKIKYHTTIGMDRITPIVFENQLENHIQVISKKALSGTYRFTHYREILISKGRGKAPRVISIPTIRDKLALSAYHQFLSASFADALERPLLHSIIGDITKEIVSGKWDGYVKIDITQFYASINHDILLKKLRQRIRKKEALHFLKEAITTDTIPKIGSSQKTKRDRGVPEGLSISNILADIYLSAFAGKIYENYKVRYYRYVDDILILCPSPLAEDIEAFCVHTLISDFDLSVNKEKTLSGKISDGVAFLGYKFFDNKVSVRPSSEEKLEASIEELFRLRKRTKISQSLFVWRLNLRIAGCILDSKKYGWMFYYSQL